MQKHLNVFQNDPTLSLVPFYGMKTWGMLIDSSWSMYGLFVGCSWAKMFGSFNVEERLSQASFIENKSGNKTYWISWVFINKLSESTEQKFESRNDFRVRIVFKLFSLTCICQRRIWKTWNTAQILNCTETVFTDEQILFRIFYKQLFFNFNAIRVRLFNKVPA